MKKRVYIDMDNVLVDFKTGIEKLSDEVRAEYEGRLDDVAGIFALMDPMPNAFESVKQLAQKYDLYVLSTAPWKNASAWCDKLEWIKRHFGEDAGSVFYKRLIISHNKNLNKGENLNP